MKVLHVIPSLSTKHGGPSFALPLMARALCENGIQVDVATTDDDGPGEHLDVVTKSPVERDGARYFYFYKQTEFYKISRPLRLWLAKNASAYDLIHIHALFSYTSFCAGRIARQQKIPYLVRPLGVLNRWGMENRRPWLKRLSFRLIEKRLLSEAAGIHFTSEQERIEAEHAGASGRAYMLPLGLDLALFQSLPGPELFVARWPVSAGRELILYLSRLDPIKGLDRLLDAFVEVKHSCPRALLVIAGAGGGAFSSTLKNRVSALDLVDDVLWTGFIEGQDKLAALAAAKVFVLPSYSENFGIAAVEALAAGVPTVLTRGVGIAAEMQQNEAGLLAGETPTEIAAAIIRLLREPELARRLSTNARQFAEKRFSIAAMGSALSRIYTELAGSNQKPR